MNYQNNKTETSVIQLALKRAGFLDGEIDGIFGSDTRNAVISFQKFVPICRFSGSTVGFASIIFLMLVLCMAAIE